MIYLLTYLVIGIVILSGRPLYAVHAKLNATESPQIEEDISAIESAETIEEVQAALLVIQKSKDDDYSALRKFDIALKRAAAVVKTENPQRSISWGKLGVMYSERDLTWHQGGTLEAATTIRTAKELAMNTAKQLESQWQLMNADTDTESALLVEECENVSRALRFARYEAFAWTIQEGILLIASGQATKALQTFDEALDLIKETSASDSKERANVQGASQSSFQSSETKKLEYNSKRATVYHHLGDLHLRLLREPEIAARYLQLSLNLDPCRPEAGEGRLRLVHAIAASIAAEDRHVETKTINPTTDVNSADQHKINRQLKYLQRWQRLGAYYEQELHGVGKYNSDAKPADYVEPLQIRCQPSVGQTRLKSTVRPQKPVSKGKLETNEETQKRQESDPTATRSAANQASEPSHIDELSNELNHLTELQKRVQPSHSTLLRWALYQIYDHISTHALSAAEASAVPSATEGLPDTPTQQDFLDLAKRHQAMSWGYLQQAHEDEMWLRYRYNAHSATHNTPSRPNTTRTLEGVSDSEYIQRYSLAFSVSATEGILKTFVPGYWPPTKEHLEHVGYQPGAAVGYVPNPLPWESPIFIVGFFRTGSSLLERMLSMHSRIATIGEDSVLSFEMRALLDDLMRITESTKRRIVREKEQGNKKPSQLSKEEADKEAAQFEADAEKSESRAKDAITAIKYRAASILQKMHARATGQMALSGRRPQSDAPIPEQHSLHRTNNQISPKTRIIDKMLINYRAIGLIHLLYPDATILHMVRDPMDTLYSCYRNRFADDNSVYALEIESLVVEYRLYLETMAHWRRVLPPHAPIKGLESSDTSRIVDIPYRDLVVNPEKTLKRILRKMKLPWEASVLQYHKNMKHLPYAKKLRILSDEQIENSNIETLRMDVNEEGFHNDGSIPDEHMSQSDSADPAEDQVQTLPLAPPRTVSYMQVLQPLYTTSVGGWTKHAMQLRPLALTLGRVVEELYYKSKALPFFDPKVENGDPLNWRLNPLFNYSAQRDPMLNPFQINKVKNIDEL